MTIGLTDQSDYSICHLLVRIFIRTLRTNSTTYPCGHSFSWFAFHAIIRGAVSKKCPHFFPDFVGNSRTPNPNKSQTKWANITVVQSFCAYKQAVSTFSFILYYLFILLPHYLRQLPFSPPPLPPPEYASPPYRSLIRNIKTLLPPTSDKALATAEPLHQPPCFRRLIWHCAWCRLWWRTPFSLTLAIPHCRRW